VVAYIYLQDVVNPTVDMTRNTVQKSVCVLSKLVRMQSLYIVKNMAIFLWSSSLLNFSPSVFRAAVGYIVMAQTARI